MPEGPEIRRAADHIAALLVGEKLERVEFGLPQLQPYSEQLVGCHVTAVQARGKAMLTFFDNALVMYSHNQLYGLWRVARKGQLPATKRSLRVGLHTRQHSAVLYSASDIEIMPHDQFEKHPFISRIGPDVLSEKLQWQDVVERLCSQRFRNRSLGALYLDQQFLAGLGNYLRSEILFAAAVHYRHKPARLSENTLSQLARVTLRLCQQSYETGGVVNDPAVVQQLQTEGVKKKHYRFAVFGRESLPCYHCHSSIEREAVGSRRLYLCPQCQPDPAG